MKRVFLTLLFILLSVSVCFAAGSSCRVTGDSGVDGLLRRIDIAWTADDADGSIPNCTINLGQKYYYYLYRAVTDPGATAPTDNYDIVVNDEWGFDHADGGLANRDASTTERSQFFVFEPTVGNLTVQFSNNSVNSAVGELVLIFTK